MPDGLRERTELRCLACGYGIVVGSMPEMCPMCHCSNWAQTGPFLPRSAGDRQWQRL